MVVGIDLSLRATGIARIGVDSQSEKVKFVDSRTILNPPNRFSSIHSELETVKRDVIHAIPPEVDLVVMEYMSLRGTGNMTALMHGLWWMVAHELWWVLEDALIVYVAPLNLIRYATGSGRPRKTSKKEVLNAIQTTFGHPAITDHNQADALVLAYMGLHYCGVDLKIDLPCPDAIHGVMLPEACNPA